VTGARGDLPAPPSSLPSGPVDMFSVAIEGSDTSQASHVSSADLSFFE
jgi:hypothetical protein